MVASGVDAHLDAAAAPVARTAGAIAGHARRHLHAHGQLAAARRAVLEAYDPRRQLARGWTLTRTADGRLVRQASGLARGDVLVTTFVDGSSTSTVSEVRAGE